MCDLKRVISSKCLFMGTLPTDLPYKVIRQVFGICTTVKGLALNAFVVNKAVHKMAINCSAGFLGSSRKVIVIYHYTYLKQMSVLKW